MAYAYATQNMTDKMAKAVKVSMAISTKQSIEIANQIKGKAPKDAIEYLTRIVEMRAALPYTRFNDNTGHRKGGMGPGGYPVAAGTAFIALIKNVVANAAHQSLDENKLVISSIVVQKGAKTYKYSRVRGLKAKNTHVEIVVEEVEPKAKTAKTKVDFKAKAQAARARAQ